MNSRTRLAGTRAACSLLAALVPVLTCGESVTTAANELFRAGAATADLTPGEGVSLDGPISKPGPVRGVHDPLTARALVMDLGDATVAIVVNDMCLIDREVYDQAKAIVYKETGIPVQNQLMSATHSHATPRVVRRCLRPQLGQTLGLRRG